jgi:hypothetical protein
MLEWMAFFNKPNYTLNPIRRQAIKKEPLAPGGKKKVISWKQG